MTKETISPRTLNLGELFLSLLKAVLQPLGLFITLPFMLILPGFGATLYYHVQKNQEGHFLRYQKGLKKLISFGLIFKIEVLYLSLLYGFSQYFSYKADLLFRIYEKAALSHQVLQIATPEQQEYAKGIYLLLYLGLILVFAFYILTLTYVNKVLYFRELQSSEENSEVQSLSYKTVLKAVFYNLHLYLILLLLLTVLAGIIETHFARYKLLYIESVILNTSSFNPVIAFMFLRVILANIVISTLSLISLSSLGIIPKISFKNKE